MAKKSIIARNNKREVLARRSIEKRTLLKEKAKNTDLSLKDRMDAQKKLNSLPRDTSMVRYQNRCAVCGRAHGVYKKFQLCRIHLREAVVNGFVPGVRKASW